MIKFKYFNVFTIVLILLQAVMPIPAMAMASAAGTDLPDYAPGSAVTLSGDNSNGAGYLPAESVHVDVSGPNGFATSCEALANENGAWFCQVTLPSDAADGTYDYTTIGQTSGVAENGSFTVTAPPPPGVDPTEEPTVEPTAEPTQEPTAEPTAEPTQEPTAEPTAEPTQEPTSEPTPEPAPVYTPSGPPFIQSDKGDYEPGELVTLTSGNWHPGEWVTVFVNDDLGQTWSITTNKQADINGGFVYQFQLPTWFVATYRVIATGESSGVATTTFTDGNVKVRAAPNGVSFSLIITEYSGSTSCTTGAGTPNTDSNVNSNNGKTIGVGNTNSIKLEAAAFSIGGGAFTSWVSSDPFTVLGPRIICVSGNFSSTHEYLATYNTEVATALSLTAPSPVSITYGSTDPVTLTATLTRTSNNAAVSGATIAFLVDSVSVGTAITNAGGVATLSTYNPSALNAGSNNVQASFAGATISGTAYLASTSNIQALVVNQKSVTASVTALDKTYDGTTAATIATCSLSGVLSGDAGDVTCLAGSAAFDNANAGTGKTVTATGISLNGSKAGNYQLSSTTATTTANIDKANPLCSVTGYSVTYDGNPHTATGACTGVGGPSDVLSGLDLSATTHTVVGSYTDNWTFTDVTGNYDDDSGTVNNEITKASADCAISGYTGVYNGNPHGASGVCTGVNGETLAGLNLGASFTNVPGGTATWTFTDVTGNYNDQSGTAAIVIGKADASCTVNGYDVVYDGDPHTATGSCLGVNDEVLAGLDLSATTHTDAGSYTDTWTFTDVTSNYNGTSGTVENTIEQADAACSVTGYNGVYDGDPHGATGSCIGVNGEDLSAGLSLGNSFTNVPGGTANWSFEGGTNYLDESGSVQIIITKADAACTVNGYTGVYDGDPHGAAGSCLGVKGEILAGLDLGASFTHVPGGTANWSFTDVTGNYNDTSGTAEVVITPAEAVCDVDGYTGVFDGDPHGAAGSCTGVDGEDLSADLDLGASFTDVPGGTAYWSFTDTTGNYNNQSGTAEIVITQAASTTVVTCEAGPFTYTGSAIEPCSILVTGAGGLSLTPDPVYTNNINAGTATASYVYPGDTNLTGSSGSEDFTIDKAVLSVNAVADSKTYGEADPDFSWTYSGFVSSDNAGNSGITGLASCSRTAGENVVGSPYTITCAPGTLLSPNYSFITGATAEFTIGKALLTVTADSFSITYGDDDPVFTFEYSGFVLGDGAGDVDTAPVCSMADPGPHSAAGSPYEITCSGGVDDNYAFHYVEGSLSVGKALLTVTADSHTITYGENDPAFTFDYSGFVLGDDENDVDTAPACGTADPGPHSAAGSPYAITCSGGVDDNYAFHYVEGSLTVEKAELTVTANDKTISEGAPWPAFDVSYDGFEFNEDPSVLDGTLTCASTAPNPTTDNGSFPITCSGQTSDNYIITYQPGTLTVTNVDPTATLGNNGPVDEGSPVTVSFSDPFDPSSVDTSAGFHYAFSCTNGDLSGATYAASGTSDSTNCIFNDNSTYTVKARILDKDGGYTEYTTDVTVNNVTPVVDAGADDTIDEGSSFSGSGSFTDPGADIWAATVDYGDGTGVQNLALNLDKTFSLNHTYADDGLYTVTVCVSDDESAEGCDTLDVTVDNVAPTLVIIGDANVNEASLYTLSLSSSDPGADTITKWTIDWGDGTIETIDGDPPLATHTYADGPNSYTITATATDEDGTWDANSQPVQVNNVAPTLTISGDAAVNEGSLYTLNLSSSDPGADTITSWTIDWGDGEIETVSGNPASATHTFADGPANYTIEAIATDEDGTFNANTQNVQVNNVDPVMNAGAGGTINEGSAFSGSGSFSDPGADTWTATVDYGDDSGIQPLTLSGKTFGLNHVYDDNGSYTVSVCVTDDDGGSDCDSLAVTVENVNPTSALGNNGPVNEGSPATISFSNQIDPSTADTSAGFHYAFSCTDGDLSGATYAGSGMSASTTCTFADNGTYTVKGRIFDKDGGYTEYTTVVTVNNVTPVVDAGLDASIAEGSTFSGTGSFTDPGADTWTATVDYGDGSGEQLLALDGKDFSLGHTYIDNGSYPVTVCVADDEAAEGCDTLTVTVSNVTPLVDAGVDGTINEGSTFGGFGSFTDPGADSWTATVNYGDGSGVQPLGLSGKTFTLSHTYTNDGFYTVQVCVKDDENATGCDNLGVTVNNVLPVVDAGLNATISEGSTFSGSGSFTDPGADTWTASVNYGDGSGVQGLALNVDRTFALSHTYADDGSYPVNVCVSDDDGMVCDTLVVTVQNVAPTIEISGAANVNEGSLYSLTLGAVTDPGADTITSYTVHWGDGTSDTYTSNGLKTHTYADGPNNYDITVDLEDEDGTFEDQANSFGVMVDNVEPTIVISGAANVDEGSLYSLDLGAVFDPGADTISSYIVHWGDGSSNAYNSNSIRTHTYADGPNTYNITVNLIDEDGTFLDQANALSVTVNNVTPSVDAGADDTINEGSSFSGSGSFTDPGADAWAATVDYGDGSEEQPISLSGKNFSLSHTYADDGSYTVEVCVTDKDGATGCDTLVVTVNNVEPTIAISGAAEVDEGSLYSVDLGAVTDPGTDTISSYIVHWGDGSSDTYGSAGVKTHTYTDGPNTYDVTVDLVDEDGTFLDQANALSVEVNNVVPTVSALDITGGSGTACTTGNTVTLNFSISDPGLSDGPWEVEINWGDGNYTIYNAASQGVQGPFTHIYGAGTFTITVKVKDKNFATGSNVSSTDVSFLWNLSGILQPINPGPPNSIFKYGSTIPVKVRVTDCDDLPVGSLTLKVTWQVLNSGTPTGSISEPYSTSAADTGNLMRFVPADNQYIFNLNSRSFPVTTGSYRLYVSIWSGSTQVQQVYADIGIKTK